MLLHGAWKAELKCRGHRSCKSMLHFTTHCTTARFITWFGAVFLCLSTQHSFFYTQAQCSGEQSYGFWLLLGLQNRVCIAVHLEKDPKAFKTQLRSHLCPHNLPEVTWMPLRDALDPKHGETQELSPLTSVSLQALQKTSDQPSALQQIAAEEESLCLPSQGLKILVLKCRQSFFITKHHGLCKPRRLACLLLLLWDTGLLTLSSSSLSFSF